MLTIAALQFRPTHGRTDANIDRIVDLVHTTEADIVVFPELATSGYLMLTPAQSAALALPPNGEAMGRVRAAADATGRVVVVGFPEAAADGTYNSAMICRPHQRPLTYRKTHLFYRERDAFLPGDTGFFVVHLDHLDCTLGTMICYDWRFPESARSLALLGADVVVCPSNLVTPLWPLVMPARAVENKVYLVVANRDGTETVDDETVTFNGRSAIYGFEGQTLAAAGAEGASAIMAVIDPSATRNKAFNAVNDIFADRRPECYVSERPHPSPSSTQVP